MEKKIKLKQCVALATAFLLCAQVNAQVVINEYCSSSTSFLDEDGDNFDWVELYNTTDADVNLEGWSLSDDADNLAKWQFPSVSMPAKSFLHIFTSSKDRKVVAAGKFLHTNFNISADGETVYLVNASGAIVHQTDSVVVPNDASRGLYPDGSSNWVFFAKPTPGLANTTKAYATSQTSTVTISPRGGVMQSSVTVTLSSEGNTPIYYTTDCTIPNPNDPDNSAKLYTEPIQIDSTTVIRAITSNENLMPALPATQTYIYGTKLWWVDRDNQGNPITTETVWVPDGNNGGWNWGGHNETRDVDPNKYIDHASTFALPVVSLTTEPDNLWDYKEGIYVEGPHAAANDPHYGANYHEDWERPIHVELYWTDGKQLLDQDAGVQISGAYSRMNKQKSMAIHARKSYGEKYFNAKLFDELDLTRFKAFTLRDSGNDFGNTHFRDAMITHLVANNNIDIQAYQPTVVFLNGEYWGVLNLREKLNEDYIECHYPHISANKVDLIVASDVTKNLSASEGFIDDYDDMISYIKSNDLSNDACYSYINSLVDIDEYVEYMVSEIYGSNNDWPHNNVKFWKSQADGSRWRWFLYDTDQSYSIWGDQANDDKLGTCLEERDTHGNTWANMLFRNLAKNETFKNTLSNRFADRMNNEFLPKNVKFLIDSLNANIKPEIKYHNKRWDLGDNSGNVDNMKKFSDNRPKAIREHLRKHFKVGNDMKVTVDANDAKAGYIQLNSLTLKSFPWSGKYFANVPISIRAVARPGFKFVRWEDANGNTVETHAGIQSVVSEEKTFKAIFETEVCDYNSIVINEINYKSGDEQDTKDWIELYNTTASVIDISNWVISDDDKDDAFKIPAGTKIAPYGYLVICENQKKLFKYWPGLTNFVGDFQFGLGKADVISLYDSEGTLIDVVEYDSKSNWPDANGNGYTMALVDPFADNEGPDNWAEDELYGTPGSQNGLFKPSHTDFSVAGSSVDVEEATVPQVVAMCYPNPFKSEAAIEWEQAAEANVAVAIFTAQGTELANVCDGWYSEGTHQIDITHLAANWTPGLYFAKVTIEGKEPVIIKIIKQ